MIINKEKNQQIEIDEKLSDLVETEEENRFVSRAGYHIFAFLFRVLVVTGQPHFYFVALIGLLLGQDIVGRAIGSMMSTGGEVAIGLLGLSLWKVLISFRTCCTFDIGSQVFFSSI